MDILPTRTRNAAQFFTAVWRLASSAPLAPAAPTGCHEMQRLHAAPGSGLTCASSGWRAVMHHCPHQTSIYQWQASEACRQMQQVCSATPQPPASRTSRPGQKSRPGGSAQGRPQTRQRPRVPVRAPQIEEEEDEDEGEPDEGVPMGEASEKIAQGIYVKRRHCHMQPTD